MNKDRHPKDMVSTKNKNKALLCSTPEHGDSPSRDSDSICDSECGSPVPFLCTQDGAEGETDVVWNFYTPKSGHAANQPTSRDKNSTPLSRKSKKSFRAKAIEKHLPKRRPVKPSQKKTELFQELYELNQNLHELMSKKKTPAPEKQESGSEDDIFVKSQECSPKCLPRSSSRCLRKNVLSSNFSKPDPDTALESDDSMNECLIKASQIVEEKILKTDPVPMKRTKYENQKPFRTDSPFKLDQDSMDALINTSMKMDSPIVNKIKKCESPCINNDSFDNFVGNLNDSALEQLTQMPIKRNISSNTTSKDWMVKEVVVYDSSPVSKSLLCRHNSMPASPSLQDANKPSTSGMSFGRFNSMPFNKDNETGTGDSPNRCTPEEIKKKHQLAREKLLAKRLLPFTSQQTQSLPTQLTQPKKTQFQPKFASTNMHLRSNSMPINVQKEQPNNPSVINKNNPQVTLNEQFNMNNSNNQKSSSNPIDLKQLIEKKRQEALLKLRRRQPPNK